WNGELTAVKDNLRDTVFALLSFPPKPSFKRLTVAAGEDCDPDELEALLISIMETYPQLKTSFIWGGQPHHPIMLSLE
ncbi:MAG: hypothetical protein K6G50_08070, partial [bacterium]|nr:hypothetical protein [bacterium]